MNTLYNIYIITNRKNSHKYIGFSQKSINNVWKDTLQNYTTENNPLYNSMRHFGVENYKISILEEINENKVSERVDYWISKYTPEYNQEVLEHNGYTLDNKQSYKAGKRRWGYQRKKKPTKQKKNVIKSRNLETGKISTHHGWKAAAESVGGHVPNIRRAVREDGTAYGYKWWIYKQAVRKRRVYGVHKNGHITKVFGSITEAMKACGENDRGKGICTSIKWGSRWKGYHWYYATSGD